MVNDLNFFQLNHLNVTMFINGNLNQEFNLSKDVLFAREKVISNNKN